MKFLKCISLFCFLPIIFFLLGAYTYSKCDAFFYPKIKQEKIEKSSEDIFNDSLENEMNIEVANVSNQITTCDTQYIVKEYDERNDTEVETIETIPIYFMGLSREELMEAVNNYELSPSFNDLQKGFKSIQLTYFSREKIIVKKNYVKYEKEDVYYLKVEDNKIVVYQSDMETVYMTTEIEMDKLPDDLQQEIINVKCINNLESLYDFLESYSS